MTPPPPSPPELLAPAGSWESFLAGLDAGADAFYLGLDRWSARGRARNFGLGDLARLLPLAHAEGRRVYVALNTLLTEAELPRALDAVWELRCLGADALILQDLGLWHACRRAFPEVRLHASTQMSVHDSAGVRRLERMGFSRVVLARECTLAEIRAIRAASALPVEVFVHGALCYSVSGQCLASTVLAGGSANRGWCGQPCRWNYRTGQPEPAHPFSPSDLDLLGRVGELADAGVAALKIEGRLKGPDYVAAVVRAYRTVLDAPPEHRAEAEVAARAVLAGAPGRPATQGYADSPRPAEVLRRGGRPAFGNEVGRVLGWRDGTAVIGATAPLGRGDRLRIASAATGEGVSLVLRRFRREGGRRVFAECPSQVSPGDRVYRVRTAAAEEREQELGRRARTLRAAPGLGVRAAVRLEDAGLRLRASCGPVAVELLAPVPRYPAERRPLTPDTLRAHLGRLGGSGFWLESLAVEGVLPPVVLPPSALKEARRRLVSALEEALEEEAAARRALAEELRRAPAAGPGGPVRLWLRVEDPASLPAAAGLPCHRLVVALNRGCLRERRRLAARPGAPEGVAWELPPWIAEGDLPLFRDALEELVGEGFREAVVTNLGHLELLEGLPIVPIAGRELHALNGWAASGLAALGCTAFTPSPETDHPNLANLAGAGWPLPPVVYAYGDLPLFVTRLDPGEVVAPGASVATVDGRRLAWAEVPEPLGQPWARVWGPEPLSWSHRREELAVLGVSDLLCDLVGRDPGELRTLAQAVVDGAPLAGTTELNYRRGLR